jgi:glycosyltransferase involved in cell wall biosynthesis
VTRRTAAIRPRVAILGSRGYPSTYSGFETLVRRLAPDLAGHGFDVSVYCRVPEHPIRWSSSYQDGVRRIATPGIDRKTSSTLSFGLTGSVDALVRGLDAVLVLNVANGFYLPMLRARGIRTAVNVDGLEWERAKWNRLGRSTFRLGARLVARFADEIIVDSKAIGERWQDLFGRRGVFIPYGADVLGARPPTRIRQLGLVPGTFGLVVARLVPENSIDLILDAVESSTAPFVVVGAANYDNPVVGRLERLSACRSEFRWLGHVHDQELLSDLWAHCGVYVHGHSAGGTNPSLLQALGAGSPTLALDTVFNREVLGYDEQLFRSSEDLSALIASVLDSRAKREEIGRRGPKIIHERYTWEASLSEYRDLLEHLIT